jgi:hypothetical protein
MSEFAELETTSEDDDGLILYVRVRRKVLPLDKFEVNGVLAKIVSTTQLPYHTEVCLKPRQKSLDSIVIEIVGHTSYRSLMGKK